MTVIKQPPKFRYVNGFNPEKCTPTEDFLGVQVWEPVATLLNGENKGTEVEEVKLNQIAKIKSKVGPRKFNAMVGFNPELAEYGAVSINPVLEDNDCLELVIKAYKPFRLTDFPYIFTMWVVE